MNLQWTEVVVLPSCIVYRGSTVYNFKGVESGPAGLVLAGPAAIIRNTGFERQPLHRAGPVSICLLRP